MIARGVLWSDPIAEDELRHNENRGIGVQFGPAQTRRFMERKLETHHSFHRVGHDARRPEIPSIMAGFCVDHDVGDAELCALFGAELSTIRRRRRRATSQRRGVRHTSSRDRLVRTGTDIVRVRASTAESVLLRRRLGRQRRRGSRRRHSSTRAATHRRRRGRRGSARWERTRSRTN